MRKPLTKFFMHDVEPGS